MESEVGTNTNTQDIETLDIIIDLPSNKVELHLSHSLPQNSKLLQAPIMTMMTTTTIALPNQNQNMDI